MKTKNNLYLVATKIGGWNQNPLFYGTKAECKKYLNSCFNNEFIAKATDYKVDYL